MTNKEEIKNLKSRIDRLDREIKDLNVNLTLTIQNVHKLALTARQLLELLHITNYKNESNY